MSKNTLTAIQEAVAANRLVWRQHALARMMERGIRRHHVHESIRDGNVIEHYPNDNPFPCFLIAGQSQGHMLHVVVAYDKESSMCYVVTTYEPDTEHFKDDLKTRR